MLFRSLSPRASSALAVVAPQGVDDLVGELLVASMSCVLRALVLTTSIVRIWNSRPLSRPVSWMTLLPRPTLGELLADVGDGHRRS